MAWKILTLFRQNPRQGHEALFDLDQGVIAEQRASAALRDLAEVGEENLETLARAVEASQRFEGGDQVVAAAARAYREGLAALMAPTSLFPADAEARRETMQAPFVGSTASQPTPVNGPPGESSRRAALPDASIPANGQGLEQPEPRRGRGRPLGSRNKLPQATSKDNRTDESEPTA